MHSQDPYKCKIPTYEALDAMKDLSAGAFKLLIYYYSRSTGWSFDDLDIANTLDVAPDTLRKLKKELIDKEYLLINKGTTNVYFVGKRAVKEWKYPADEDELELD